jgi:integrase
MNLQAPHLFKSRHGVWYVRIVVPKAVRDRHPELPAELKRSTETAVRRVAEAFSQRMCIDFLTRFSNSQDLAMHNFFEPPLVAPMMIRCEPGSGRITHLQSDPHDPPETLRLLENLLRGLAQVTSPPASTAAGPVVSVDASSQSVVTPPAGATRWLSEAIAQWLREIAPKNALDANTIKYTYAPALKVFRELISTDVRRDDTGATGIWDIQTSQITPALMDQFVSTFWSFPDRRGRRKHADAKEILAEEGRAQSRNNALKNFSYIRMFVKWAAKRQEISKLARDCLEAALEDAAPDPRAAHGDDQALTPDDEFGHGTGYVAFTKDEVRRLFGGPEFLIYAAGNAARYWIALLGLLVGLRINEAAQLRTRDFKEYMGIWCVVVTASALNEAGQRAPILNRQRVKTFAGRRMLPLHPLLLQLGLIEYVKSREESGKDFLFDLPWYRKSGFGHYPTRDFPRLTKATGVYQNKTKVHHSFRATLSQELESHGLLDTLIDRLLGHKVRTIRARHYGRNSTGVTLPLQQVYEALCKVDFGVSIPSWKDVSVAPKRHQAKCPEVEGALSIDSASSTTPG